MTKQKLMASLSGLLAMVMIVTLLFSGACAKEEGKPTIVIADGAWTSAEAVDRRGFRLCGGYAAAYH
jgi:ABC-type proline/glycine betaine transport system substrate-binding protein